MGLNEGIELHVGGNALGCAPALLAGYAPQTADRVRSPIPAPGAKSSALVSWTQALAGMMRFYSNKLRHGFFTPNPSGSADGAADPNGGPVRLVRAAMAGLTGSLNYCLSRDARGILRGAQPAWMYLHDFAVSGPQKSTILRRLLAQLPAGVSFHFVCSPDLPDSALVRQAFHSAGFRLMDVETNIYTPPAGHGELIDTLSGKSIKGTLRRARRDLEIVEISVRDYFRFQRANLAVSGKKSYRDDNLDRLMLEEALRRKNARILAARRRSTDTHPGPHPIDAAIICLWDDHTRLFKLWRLTYRTHSFGPVMPHVDASKLLVLAAMQEAADRKMLLETDGSTPGLAKLYALFGPGVFRRTTRLQCERETLWAMLVRLYPSLSRRLGAIMPMAALRKNGPPPDIAIPI